MGLFSSKKKTYVSSVVYPLGEDDGEKKTDFLQYTVINATMQNRPIGEAITEGYLRGQGMSLRNAYQYARDKYTYGVPTSAAKYLGEPDIEELRTVLQPSFPGSTLEFLTTMVGTADHEWWAEQHLTEKYGYDRASGLFDRPPAGVDNDAQVAYDLEPDGRIRILLMNTGGATTVVEFRPQGYAAMADFVHACFQAVQNFISANDISTRDATPGEQDSVSTSVTIVERAGEIQTTTERTETTISTDGLTATVEYKKTVEVRTRPQYFLYRLGSGEHPILDAWLSDAELTAPYYPAVPLRVNNVNVTDESHQDTELYKTSKKLLKRVGIKIDEVSQSLHDNDSIKDIDYAFVVFGVSLNSPAQESKRYLFEYFQYLRGITSPATTKDSHAAWVSAGDRSGPPQMNAVQIYSEQNRADNYDVKIQWDYIDTKLISGEIFPGAKVGDCDISMSGTRVEFSLFSIDIKVDSSKLYARRQVDENTYEEMEISGLYYENFIYKGKSISISAYDAFHDPEEEGFIVPMNHQILKAMSLRDVTNLGYFCCHMVMNCYKVVKQKWYQTGIFKVILVIVAILIVFFTWGAGTPVAITILGVTFTVVGTLMVLLAATLYVLALMVLSNIIAKAATAAFGEKWGAIIAMVVMLVIGGQIDVSQVGATAANAATTASTGVTAGQVINASSLVLKAYGHYAAYQTKGVYEDIGNLQAEYEKKFDELEEMWEKMLGTNTDIIDIQGMTEATQLQFERMDVFLGRTLITGNDICEITNGQVTGFAELGLMLPNT